MKLLLVEQGNEFEAEISMQVEFNSEQQKISAAIIY